MIKDNQVLFNRLHIVLDGVAMVISFTIAWLIMFASPMATTVPGVTALSAQTYFSSLFILVPLLLILYAMNNLYSSKRVMRIRTEMIGIFYANVIGVALWIIGLFMMANVLPWTVDYSRRLMLFFFVINLIITGLYRYIIRKILYHIRRRGNNLKHIILVGYSRAAEAYMDRLYANAQWGYVVHGILDDHVPRGTEYKGTKVLGGIDNLEIILPENKMDEITITLSLGDYDKLERIVDMCEKSGVHTKFIPDYNSLFPSNPYTEDLMGLPLINIRYVPLSNTLYAFIKRCMDIAGACFCLVLFSPVMLAAAIGTAISGGGPVIFKQERIGMHGRPFQMYKFRTMIEQAPEDEERAWTTKEDARVTRFGRILRKTSIDEMPQFVNVLMGNMSLVGPRPERPQFVEKFKEEIPRYMVKHQVRPGITGWAQVNGSRGDTSIRKRIEYDLYYIENWSIGFDFKILLMTIFRGFINKNAY